MSSSRAAEQHLSPELSPARQWLALAVLMLAVLVIAIDNTVLGFAVPELSADLQPGSTALLWIVDSYAFVLAGLLVTMGNLGDRIGRRRLLLIGSAGFAAASTLAAFSTSPAMLITARALLGVAGATLMPSTLSLIRTTFPDPSRRRIAIGLWTSGFAVGSALGPIVGGWLLEHFWWGSVFLIAVPVMALMLVVGPVLLPESRNDDPGPFDLWSSVLSLTAVLPVVYAMKKAAEHGPSWGLGLIALCGVALGVVFVHRQRRLDEPLLDVSLFSDRAFATAIVTNLLANFAFIGAIFLVAQYLQLVLGLRPLAAGLHLLPGMTAAFVASLGAAALMRRLPPWWIISASMVSASAGFAVLLVLGGADDGRWVVVAMALIALGYGAASSLGANLVMAIVPPQRAGSASAVSETAFELGAATGIAVLGSVAAAVFRQQFAANAASSVAGHGIEVDTLAEAVAASIHLSPESADALVGAARSAFAGGIHAASVVAAVLLLAGAVASGVSLRRVRSGGAE